LKESLAKEKANKEAKEGAEKAEKDKKLQEYKDTAAKETSLSQKKSKDLDEGHSDPNFLPHPILPNTLHADQM
jgi:hypothetical protein